MPSKAEYSLIPTSPSPSPPPLIPSNTKTDSEPLYGIHRRKALPTDLDPAAAQIAAAAHTAIDRVAAQIAGDRAVDDPERAGDDTIVNAANPGGNATTRAAGDMNILGASVTMPLDGSRYGATFDLLMLVLWTNPSSQR